MIHENTGLTYIRSSAFHVKNSIDKEEDELKTETIEGKPEDFIPHESTNEYRSLKDPQILYTGNSKDFGIWRFTPELKLTVPPLAPPGNHKGEIIISIN